MMKIIVGFWVFAFVFGVFVTPVPAGPTIVELTTQGSSGSINGALFVHWDGSPQGTGVFDPFVRIQAHGNDTFEAGYNTDGPIEFQTKDHQGHNWTHSLLLNAVPIVTIGSVDYREFALDINQNSGGSSSLLSLDDLKIYLEATPDLTGWPDNFSDPIYSMDNSEDNWVTLEYDLNGGSGNGDMLAYIPNSLFSGPNQYVYLYSEFGTNFGANSGFEEWATLDISDPPVIPAPGAILLGGIGVCLVGWLKKRKSL